MKKVMDNSTKKLPKTVSPSNQAEEWDMRAGMGILPSDIPLTQNIGCVGSNPKTKKSTIKK
ncbi:hypothetical protein B0E43_00445 [Algoriphagus sp. A40]|nr:hypothetical protein B0E43_00445 [Algoriphagus sp. A40]